MKKRVLLSWSSGKDCAWALHVLRQDDDVEVVGLFTTVNEEFDRVAMHAVRCELLKRQAEAVGLPVQLIRIPYPCSNEDYDERMREFVGRCREQEVDCFAFGDLYLEDVRDYRVERLEGTGITPIFPLWGMDTRALSEEMIANGLRAVMTCIDPRKVPESLAGHEYNEVFLEQMPAGMDPCGENGEFHSFAFDGPMFQYPVRVKVGETVTREGFVFTDVS